MSLIKCTSYDHACVYGPPPPSKKTILEQFPEYGFVPTSVVKGNTFLKVLSVLFLVVSVGFFITGVIFVISKWNYYLYTPLVPLFAIIWPPVVATCLYLWILGKKKTKTLNGLLIGIVVVSVSISIYYCVLSLEYRSLEYTCHSLNSDEYVRYWDYHWPEEEHGDLWFMLSCIALVILAAIQKIYRVSMMNIRGKDYITTQKYNKSSKKYYIFVKDRKFGIVKKGLYKTIVPAEYDRLSWRDDNTLIAEQDGQKFLIDIFGNKLS